ncbi:MarR family winged helix-turn-helix transcriptional regulator [Eubacteriaceae bacterium ES3]|nr:MarR family winged helix-turn-helix transcriptional regulator [Eubacteriaceae bacterium ES3]
MKNTQRIGFEIKTTSNRIRQYINEVMEKEPDITGLQGWIIGYIFRHQNSQEVFQRDIEKEFNVRRSTVSGILNTMEKKGLIIREAVDFDARLKKITLTDKAVTCHQLILEKLQIIEEQLKKGLSEEELTQFFLTLEKINKNIK